MITVVGALGAHIQNGGIGSVDFRYTIFLCHYLCLIQLVRFSIDNCFTTIITSQKVGYQHNFFVQISKIECDVLHFIQPVVVFCGGGSRQTSNQIRGNKFDLLYLLGENGMQL